MILAHHEQSSCDHPKPGLALDPRSDNGWAHIPNYAKTALDIIYKYYNSITLFCFSNHSAHPFHITEYAYIDLEVNIVLVVCYTASACLLYYFICSLNFVFVLW